MEEVKAKEIMEAYNRKYSPKLSLDEVRKHLETHVYFNLDADTAAVVMHRFMNE